MSVNKIQSTVFTVLVHTPCPTMLRAVSLPVLFAIKSNRLHNKLIQKFIRQINNAMYRSRITNNKLYEFKVIFLLFFLL